jgi:hypothetical protein|tara:strand:+ start:108 stop:329 length:222 start_codon:yes stop_codon:yes gene_type:complete
MKYQLKNKNTGEAISLIDNSNFGLEEAKSYFTRIKQLDKKSFEQLYVVEKVVEKSSQLKYKWWHEEPKTLDEI